MNNEEVITNTTVSSKCNSCGAPMVYKPGTNMLECTYCKNTHEIDQGETTLNELDFLSFMDSYEKEEFNKTKVITCNNCKATSSVNENLRSMNCPYCSSPLVEKDIHEERYIEPHYVLPFQINKSNINQILKSWVDGFWFAPDNLKKAILSADNINGIYVPFWTFDTHTITNYNGQRGEAYYVTVGSGEQRKRVRKVRWYNKNGTVRNFYDDILICASISLKKNILKNIQRGWNPKAVIKINDNYLKGFITEKYEVDLKEGFNEAKILIERYEKESVKRDIGGDEQRISRIDTNFNAITFKHILLPIYVSSFFYNNKSYIVYINGLTGKISGERPFSITKILFAVILAIIAIAIILMIMSVISK